MRTLFKTICLFIVIGSLTSCDENVNSVIFDGNENANRTFLSFPSNTVNLPVIIDNTGSVEITLNSSTRSDVDRSFNISMIAEQTTANPLTYSLPSTVTIPAGSYQGVITVNGVDGGLVDTTAKQLVFSLADLPDNVDFDSNQVIVNIFEVCPVLAEFTGNYMMQQITAINPDDGVQMFNNQVITLVSEGETARSFQAIYLEALGIGNGPTTITFSLVCNQVIIDSNIQTTLLCVGGSPSIDFGPATTPSTYDANDDSVFDVTITEYFEEDGGCGANPYETTFRLTKL